MDPFELLEQAGRVKPADPAVLDRAAADLLTRCGEPVTGAGRGRRIRLPRMRPLQLTAGVTAIAVAAGVAVAVATAVTVPTAGAGGGNVVTTAYVINRTERALAAVQAGSAIQQTTFAVTGRLQLGANLTPSDRDPAWLEQMRLTQVTAWSYGSRTRVAGFGVGGRRVFDVGLASATRPRGHQLLPLPVLVGRAARSWYYPLSMSAPAAPPVTCQGSSQAIYNGPALMSWTQASSARWTALIREALSCGLFQLDGRQAVDGVDALRLVATPDEVQLQQGAHEVLWVSPRTFLPVRMSFGRGAAAADFRWLPPTGANLATLLVTVPHGAVEHRLPAGTGIVFWQMAELGKPVG